MKVVVFIVFACVLANAVDTSDPKQVNIALETVLRFDKKESTPGFSVIDQVHNVLESIKDSFMRRNYPRSMTSNISSRRRIPRDLTFSDFILQAAKILNEYDDTYLEDVFALIHDETRKYINRENELRDLFGNNDVRRHFNKHLGEFGDVSAEILRQHLDKAIAAVENKLNHGEKNDILDIGDFLYIGAGPKLRAALKNLERIRRTKTIRIDAVLKDTLRSLILDHYSNLSDKIKRELIQTAQDYFRDYSRKELKYSEMPVLKTVAATRFSIKNRHKYEHENKAYPKMRQTSKENPIAIYRDNKNDNTGHINKRYTNKIITAEDQKFTAATQTDKLNGNTKVRELFEMNRTPTFTLNKATTFVSDYEQSSKSKKFKSNKNKYASDTSIEKIKGLKRDDEKRKIVKDVDNSKEENSGQFMILTGGQNMEKMFNDSGREQTSSEEARKQPLKKKEAIHTLEETYGQYQTATAISVENSVTETSASSDEDNVKGNRSTVRQLNSTNMGMSGEGLTIESFENDPAIEKKVIRKHNAHDALGREDPGIDNVKEAIHNIEKQIKDVKEEVSYVKNLSACTDKPIFKAISSDEISTTPTTQTHKAKSSYRYPDSDVIERDNEEFISRNILENTVTEKAASRFVFRANYDTDNVNTTIKDTNINDTTTVIENSTIETSTTVRELNETILDTTLKISPINEDYKENMENKTKVDEINNNKTDVHAKARKFLMDISNMKFNEIDHKNSSDIKFNEDYALLPQSKILNITTVIVPDKIDIDKLFISD